MILCLVIFLFFSFLIIGVVVSITSIVKGKMLSGIVAGVFFVGIILFILVLCFSFPWWPVGLRHFYYVAKNENLHMYTPVVLEPFDFTTEYYSETFSPALKYWNEYSVGIRLDGSDFPEDFQYHGKIRVDFYDREKLIDSYTSEEIQYYKRWAMNESDHSQLVCDKAALVTFDVANFRKYRKDLKVKVTVIVPDKELKEYGDNIRLYISIDRLL